MGMSEEMCLGTLVKYAMRFGKKAGKNKADLLKLMHYTILLYHFTKYFFMKVYKTQFFFFDQDLL